MSWPTTAPPARPKRTAAWPTASVVSQRAHELGLAHRGPAADPDLPRTLDQVRLGPVVVGRALAALLADLAAGAAGRRIGDPRRLLLALALVTQLLICLLVLDLTPGHGGPPSCRGTCLRASQRSDYRVPEPPHAKRARSVSGGPLRPGLQRGGAYAGGPWCLPARFSARRGHQT